MQTVNYNEICHIDDMGLRECAAQELSKNPQGSVQSPPSRP